MSGLHPAQAPPKQAKDFAQELLGLIYRFSRLTSEATLLSASQPDLWSQIIGELASQSLQGTLLASGQGSTDELTRDEWRRRFEGWIHRELQAEVDRTAAAAGRLSPQKAEKPISPSVEVNGSPLFSNGGFSTVPASISMDAFGEGRGLPGFAYDGDPLMSAMSVDDNFTFSNQLPSPVQPFSSYPPATLDPSPFVATASQPPNGDPFSLLTPAAAASSSDAFSSTSSFSLSSASGAGASTGTVTPIDPSTGAGAPYGAVDLAAAFERIGVQPPPEAVAAAYGVSATAAGGLQTGWQPANEFGVPQGDGMSLYPPVRARASSSSLPRLITSDLSSPAASSTASSLSAPAFDHGAGPGNRPRSRSHGAQDRPQSHDLLSPTTAVGAGSGLGHRRGSSAGSHSPRFHPFGGGGGNSPVFGGGGFDSLGPPALSFSGASSPGGASSAGSGGGGHRRTKSASHTRTERTLAYDPTAVFHRNTRAVFAVHLQNSTKAEVSERDVIELVLASDDDLARAPEGANKSNAATALWRSVMEDGPEYDAQQRELDARERRSFTFVSAPATGSSAVRLPGQESDDALRRSTSLSSSTGSKTGGERSFWQVTCTPEEPYAPSVVALSSTTRTAFQPVLSFLHFPPGMLILTNTLTHQLGSKEWWRMQECPGRHEKQPGDGAWTSRWDADGEERRPSRVLLHYATCTLRKGEGEAWTLGRMARAIRECKKKA